MSFFLFSCSGEGKNPLEDIQQGENIEEELTKDEWEKIVSISTFDNFSLALKVEYLTGPSDKQIITGNIQLDGDIADVDGSICNDPLTINFMKTFYSKILFELVDNFDNFEYDLNSSIYKSAIAISFTVVNLLIEHEFIITMENVNFTLDSNYNLEKLVYKMTLEDSDERSAYGKYVMNVEMLFSDFGTTVVENINNLKKILIGVTGGEHAEILEFVKPLMLEKGYDLEIKLYSDYVLPNAALNDGELDANYFQHIPYMNYYNEQYDANLVSVGGVHYYPIYLFGNGIKSLTNIPKGIKILIPSDETNCTRALLLLAQEGLIELDSSKTIDTGITVNNIINDNGYEITPLPLEMIAVQFKNEQNILAVIGGNYALAANIQVAEALAYDEINSLFYANIIAVRSGNENDERVLALLEILNSNVVVEWILEKYDGTILPIKN